MKGKNFYKKVFPWLGASLYFFPNKTVNFLNVIETPEEILVNAKVDKTKSFEQSKSAFTQIENLDLQNYIKDLNQTEVYLLVTKPVNKKGENNTLLLLENENRLNSVTTLSKRRSQNIQTKRKKPNQKNMNLTHKLNIKPRKKLDLRRILQIQRSFPAARFWTSAGSYNAVGSKSICPIFFSKHTAEDFLIKTTKDTLAKSNYRVGLDKGAKDVVKNILNSKIITVGLGDFIHYYSSPTNEKFLSKIEFLFFPNLADLQESQQKNTNKISTKSFNFYQNNYYKLKTVNKNF